jgi:hypothetical protein
MEENMVQRFATHLCRLNEDPEVIDDLLLPRELGYDRRTNIVFKFFVHGGHDTAARIQVVVRHT